MFENVKHKLADYIISKRLRDKGFYNQSFVGVFNNSSRFFVIMPDDEKDFHHAIEVLNFLNEKEKYFMIYTYDFRVGLLPIKYRSNTLAYNLSDFSKLRLPSQSISDKLKELNFNVVIDLNRKTDIYYSFSANLVNAPFRVGVIKNSSEKYYNLLIDNKEDNPEIFYRNFLNCLQMF
jgi:Family of unknown function (DUF6913)